MDSLSALRFPGVDEPLFVVDREGRLVAHPDRERAAALEPYAGVGPLAGVDLAQDASFAGRFTAPDGARWIGTVQPVGARPFRVAAQIPESVALASIYEVRVAERIAVAVVLVLSFLVGVLFARRITRPMGELVELAKALAARRFGTRVEVKSANELALLGHAMSEASLELEASEARIRREEAIRHDLGRYLPPQIVERVVAREQDMALGGSRRTITVLFADVVAFTPLTERLPPEKVVEILNELFTILTEIVFRHGGTVDKFIGDSVMALFGAPGDQPDHAERALACAEDMLRWLDTGNAAWREAHGLTIQLAIGVNTGDCVVGNVGSERRMEYTAIGDVVNVAARLEAIARPSQILCTRATKDAAGDAFEMLDAGERELAGREGKVHLYEVAQ